MNRVCNAAGVVRSLPAAVTLDYEGEGIVSDAGLLPVAKLDRELGILAEAATRLPDPRTQEFLTDSAKQILRQ